MTPENLTLVFVAGSPRKHGGSSCCGAAAAHRASLAPRVARTALPSVARTAPPNVARAFPTSARRMGKRLNFRKAKMGGQPGRRAASSSTSAKPTGAGGRRQLDGVRKSGASSSGYVTPIASRAPSPLGGRQPHASPMSDVASVGSAASPMRVDASGGMPPPPPPPPKNRLLRKAEKHLREIDKLQMQVDAHQLLSGNGMSRLPDACELAKLQTRAATEQQIAALKPAAAAAGCSTPDLAGAVTGAYGALAAPSPRTDEHSRTGASVTRDAAAQRQLLLRPRGRLQGDGRVITDDERRALNVASQRRCRERRAALAPLLAELVRMLADPRLRMHQILMIEFALNASNSGRPGEMRAAFLAQLAAARRLACAPVNENVANLHQLQFVLHSCGKPLREKAVARIDAFKVVEADRASGSHKLGRINVLPGETAMELVTRIEATQSRPGRTPLAQQWGSSGPRATAAGGGGLRVGGICC